jgi:MFS family permease
LKLRFANIIQSHTIAFEQLLPVLFSMPESETTPQLPFKFVGGFALSTKAIGIILSTQGFLQMFAQVFVFPVVVKKLGALKTFRLVIFGYPILYFLVPYLSLVPHFFRYPAILLVLVWKVTAQSLSYPSTSLMLVSAAPSMKTLGTLNGLGQSSACLARTIGPILAGVVQAAGLRIGYSGLSWWFCATVAIFGAAVCCWQQEQVKRPSMESSVDTSVIDVSEEEILLGEPILGLSQDDEPRPSTSTLIDCMTDIREEQDSETVRKLSNL